MWLHEHPVNAARAGRGRACRQHSVDVGRRRRLPRIAALPASCARLRLRQLPAGPVARCAARRRLSRFPQRLDATYAESVVLVVETGRLPRGIRAGGRPVRRAVADASIARALGELDRRFVSRRRSSSCGAATLERVSILANDRLLVLGSRSPAGSSGDAARPALEACDDACDVVRRVSVSGAGQLRRPAASGAAARSMPRAACAPRPDLDVSLDRLLPVGTLEGVLRRGRAAARASRAGRVLVIGDFDADGATSTALVLRALRAWGFAVRRLPGAQPLRVRLRPDAGDRRAGARAARPR